MNKHLMYDEKENEQMKKNQLKIILKQLKI